MKSAEPRRALFCRCGAQWFGRYATATTDVLRDHRARCGAPISAKTFRAMGHVVTWPPTWTPIDRNEAEWSAKT